MSALTRTFTLRFENATWGDLRAFLEAGEDAGVSDDTLLEYVDDEDGAGELVGIELVVNGRP